MYVLCIWIRVIGILGVGVATACGVRPSAVIVLRFYLGHSHGILRDARLEASCLRQLFIGMIDPEGDLQKS
jgi:hypothetical protein